MPPSTSSQKTMINSFRSITGADERTAQRALKNSNYKLDAALDTGERARKPSKPPRPSSSGSNTRAPGTPQEQDNAIPLEPRKVVAAPMRPAKKSMPHRPTPAKTKPKKDANQEFLENAGGNEATTLNKMFDELIDSQKDSNDEIGVESTLSYLGNSLGVDVENAEMLVALHTVRAEKIGEITRKGFVEGWRASGVSTHSTEAHRRWIRQKIAGLAADTDYFKQVYRHTFVAGKEPDQKALALEAALVFWDMCFSPPGRPWVTEDKDWLALWKSFLDEKWTRSVNRDMWNQTLEFANKAMADEDLTFWSEDSAWPGVIDEFVQWCREKGHVAQSMATD